MKTANVLAIVTGICLALSVGESIGQSDAPAEGNAAVRPALSVIVSRPSQRDIPLTLTANGSVAAWQEAIIGAQISDLRLDEVRGQVGETVRKGQILAVFADDRVLADVAQTQAALAEAEANLADARANAQRARQVSGSGVLSGQQVAQYETSEKTAAAKVQSAKAQLDSQLLRKKHTRVVASDDGVISSRSATLGAVATPGQELFRLIRQNRLEWRAEVTAAEMARLKPGVAVTVIIPNVAKVAGKVRVLAPTIDTQSRNGLVYVDLPATASSQGLRAGMFAQGEFVLGSSSALTVPQDVLSLREGFSYVFRLNAGQHDQATVSQVKVQLGRRWAEYYEILSGISADDRLVASGAAFLADGDTVRVVGK
ncbi:efflux RND transporter periplasmic adaptor subunit [Methylovulum psychrotolerans]|uniref:efflux RND transporter periplasmic adaptor subunit n=1 Tax=Methylovulum psychrotolerans TaxID=1704499 RepID=UPI001BFF3DD2|nr:efflux RND transporter periplasmic adaptor subunit [Methylovulum psychrotolerans]MBT9098223.1 efflux RND transporter periplasmic adaptor subunit [Methylovulum psychrotolerans]